MKIDNDFTLQILRELVACDSVNPAFHDADGEPGRGEGEIVRRLEGILAEMGLDANLAMGAVLGRLAPLVKRLQSRQGHALLGPPSLHAPLLSGGEGPSIYSPECTLQLERRTIPGETPEQVMAEVRDLVAGLGDEIPADDVTVEEVLSRLPFEAEETSAVARLVGEAHWVDVESVMTCAQVLADVAARYCGDR